MDIVKEILKVVKMEKDTLSKLEKIVGIEYEKAVKEIFRCKGKIILTGVGKSGIIAKKIASTMVSTGTSAIYLNPTDGMHGDLGIVKRNDIIIAIGKSGASGELVDILYTVKKIGAKIISITANKESSLARGSDIVLYTGVDKEACPFNLAPTNSTTAVMVLGDAIALTLMKMRNFKKRDFALYHPGGILGRRLLLKVSDVMRSGKRNPVIKIDDSIKNLLINITEKMAGAVSVINNAGNLKGLVTDYDIRKVIEKGENIFTKKITDIMNKNPVSISPHAKAAAALEIMERRDRPISLLPVVNGRNRVVGMIHVHDILAKGLKN